MTNNNSVTTVPTDFSAPLTNEELAAFRAMLGITERDKMIVTMRDEFNNLINSMNEKYNDLIKTSQMQYRAMFDSFNDTIAGLTKANSAMASSIKSMSVELGNHASAIKEALTNNSSVKSVANNEFQFVSTISPAESDIWRDNANNQANSIGNLCGLSHKEQYHAIYKGIARISGIDVYSLYSRKPKKFTSIMKMIAASDELRDYFDQTVRNIMSAYVVGKRSTRTYNSISAMKCPDNIKSQICRYLGKSDLSDYDYAKFYIAYGSQTNMKYIMDSALETTGYKKVNKGFAINLFPGGYEDVVKFVNNHANIK